MYTITHTFVMSSVLEYSGNLMNEQKDKFQFSLFQVISTLPTFHKNVFNYLMAFLQELLKNSTKNHLDANILGKQPRSVESSLQARKLGLRNEVVERTKSVATELKTSSSEQSLHSVLLLLSRKYCFSHLSSLLTTQG